MKYLKIICLLLITFGFCNTVLANSLDRDPEYRKYIKMFKDRSKYSKAVEHYNTHVLPMKPMPHLTLFELQDLGALTLKVYFRIDSDFEKYINNKYDEYKVPKTGFIKWQHKWVCNQPLIRAALDKRLFQLAKIVTFYPRGYRRPDKGKKFGFENEVDKMAKIVDPDSVYSGKHDDPNFTEYTSFLIVNGFSNSCANNNDAP